eukprot:1186239-Prorocentrum_minimum.AAC.2
MRGDVCVTPSPAEGQCGVMFVSHPHQLVDFGVMFVSHPYQPIDFRYSTNVVEIAPEEGRLRFDGALHVRGGNFARSPYFKCSMGTAMVGCEMVDDNTLRVAAPAPAPEDGVVQVAVLNDGANNAGSAAFDQQSDEADLMEGLFFFDPLVGSPLPGRAATPYHAAPFDSAANLTVQVRARSAHPLPRRIPLTSVTLCPLDIALCPS